MYDRKVFGEKIKFLRKTRGYSYESLSTISGISKNTLRGIERGARVPTIETLSVLSHSLAEDLLSMYTLCAGGCYRSFLDLRQRIMNLIETRQYILLPSCTKPLNDLYKQAKTDKSLSTFQSHQICQFYFWLKGMYISKHKKKNHIAKKYYMKAIQITLPEFDYSLYHAYHYNYNELNILNSIAISEYKQHNLVIAIHILEFITHQSTLLLSTEKSFIPRLCYNLSAGYYMTREYTSSYDTAVKGIAYNRINNTKYEHASLIFRKGLSEYCLNDSNYQETLSLAVQLLNLDGLTHNANKLLQIYEYYGVKIAKKYG